MTLGNHEFDLTPQTLATALDSAFVDGAFPVLSANTILDDPSLAPLRRHVEPFTIREIGGIRVGIFGLTTPETNQLSLPAPAVISDDIAGIATHMVDTLRRSGCRVIVMLSHLGLKYDRIVAASVPGIDAIIGGHDHTLRVEPIAVRDPIGDTTWIAQADAFYRYMGAMKLAVEGEKVTMVGYRMIPLDASVPEEPTVRGVVAELMAGIEGVYGPVFGSRTGYCTHEMEEVPHDLLGEGNMDTPIGNLVADALRAATGADVAIEPGGSTAQGLPAGPITADDLFRVVGYGFSMVDGLGFRVASFDMTGAALMAGIEFGLSDIETNDEFFIQVSGMGYSYNPAAPPGARLVSATVAGRQIDPAARYRVAANEFVLAFLDAIQLPYTNARIDTALSEFAALTAHVTALDTVRASSEGRIQGIKVSSVGVRQPVIGGIDIRTVPNPFTGVATVVIELPRDLEVELEISDLGGRVAAIPFRGTLSAGRHSIPFDGSELAAGVYLCRITIDGVSRGVLLQRAP
jgi:5'-nucleotidase